ncbi:hypothetical protein ABT169_17625 [Streptomyces sp. NPDC001616]|uniref:hypothetical protein n=1 Tax=Streptomyces sp. NPDC001616 TaxID=3156648 RepID=UPI00331D420E
MKTRTFQLTLCWHLMLWRGGSRFAIGPVRTYDMDQERTRTIGATLSLFRVTVGLARFGPTYNLRTTGSWWKDFGGRLVPRFAIGGWRTTVPVLLSTGWMYGGRWPCGISFTVASRTLYFTYLCSAADYRPRGKAKRRLEGQ